MKLASLVAKNLKLLVRSKTSALIIFIGPLLLVSLLGLAYSQTSTYTLKAAVYSESYTDLSEGLITKMMNQNFQVLREPTLEDCIGSVKRSEAHSCIVFPRDMQPTSKSTVTFYVDYTKLNLVWVILDVLEAKVSEESTEITTGRTKELLEKVAYVRQQVDKGKDQLGTLKTSTEALKGQAQGAEEGVASFDVNVTLDVSLASAKDKADNILLTFSDVKTDIDDTISKVRTNMDTIDTKVGAIENQVIENITEELEDIDTAVYNIEDDLDQLNNGFYNNNQELVEKVDAIKQALSGLDTSITEAQQKMDGVNTQRDEILPAFNQLKTQTDNLIKQVDGVVEVLELAKMKMSGISVTQAGDIATPIESQIKPVSAQKTHYNSLFPGLLVLIIMITAILLGSALVLGEKKSKAFFRNNIVPTHFAIFSLATYVTALIVLFIQLVLFISVSAFFFETEILASIWFVLLLVFLVSTLFIVIGMFVGFLFRTEATATLASITVSSLFLLFSNTVMPIEAMSALMKKVAEFNPFVVSEAAVRQATLYHLGFDKLVFGMGLLAGYAIGLFALLLILQEALRKLSLSHSHKAPAMVKEKKAQKKLVQQELKTDNAADELLVKNEESNSSEKQKK